MVVRYKVNLSSRGEVVAQLLERHKAGRVKDCKHLRLERHPAGYAPVCDIEWASTENDPKLDAVMPGAYSEGHQISWPRCPQECPRYEKAEHFQKSVGRDQYEDDRERPEANRAARAPVASKIPPLPASDAEKGTLHWIFKNLPFNVWVAFVGLLGFMFVVGVHSTRLEIVRETFSLSSKEQAAAPTAGVFPDKHPSMDATALKKPSTGQPAPAGDVPRK